MTISSRDYTKPLKKDDDKISAAQIVDLFHKLLSVSPDVDLVDTLSGFAIKIVQTVGVDSCLIWRYDSETGLIIKTASFISPALLSDEATKQRNADVIRMQALSEPEILPVYSDSLEGDTLNTDGDGSCVGLIVQMLWQGKVVGLLELYTADKTYCFAKDSWSLYQALANQAAMVIENAHITEQFTKQADRLRLISLRLINAQEEERKRLSRELHDEIGQALTALKINLEIAQHVLPDTVSDRLKRSLAEAKSLAVQAMKMGRNLSRKLRPAMIEELGVISTLNWEIDRYEQRTEQIVYFAADLSGVDLSPELEITIYRIITEAMTNIARYAQASEVKIKIWLENNFIMLRVKDNGQGFDVQSWLNSPDRRNSLGLTGMQERAILVGGQLEIDSTPGHGVRIQAKIPVAS